jgi:HEAT repeat protein
MFGIVAAALLGNWPKVQTGGASQASVRIMGRDISVVAPPDQSLDAPAEVMSWSGWKGLQHPGIGLLPKAFGVDHGLAEYVKGFGPVPAPDAPVWRIKVLLSKRYEDRQMRLPLSRADEDRLLLALVLVKREIETESGLRVDIDVDEDAPAITSTFQPPAIQLSVLSRINRGSFEADDRKYRGPYHSVIALSPVAWSLVQGGSFGQLDQINMLNGPVEIASDLTGSRDLPYGGHSLSRLVASLAIYEARAAEFWMGSQVLSAPAGQTEEGSFSRLGKLPKPDLTKVLGFVPAVKGFWTTTKALKRELPVGQRAWTEDTELKVGQDADRGVVLEVKSAGSPYGSGVAIASFAGNPSAKKLSFWVKHVSGAQESIGDIHAPKLRLPSDGDWHHVTLDVPVQTDPYIFTQMSSTFMPESLGDSVYQYAGFELGDVAPSDAMALKGDPPANATIEAIAKADPSTPEGAVLFKAALSDRSASTRLPALEILSQKQAPGLEAAIGAAMDDLDGRVSEAAAAALQFQNSDAGWDLLRKALDHGVTEREKVAAGMALASRKNPNFLGPLSSLMVAKSWEARVAAANAIALNGGPLAQTLLSAFADQPEPEVRLTVVRILDPMNEGSAKRLLYASVNDPSDAVRAEACERLLANPTYLKDAHRGVQDDSRWVRIRVLNYLEGHPRKEDRPALRQAVTSSDWQVRLAALKAFLTAPDAVDAAELGEAVTKDSNPLIQAAIKDLIEKKGLKLG